jgi:hypothetical protein
MYGKSQLTELNLLYIGTLDRQQILPFLAARVLPSIELDHIEVLKRYPDYRDILEGNIV